MNVAVDLHCDTFGWHSQRHVEVTTMTTTSRTAVMTAAVDSVHHQEQQMAPEMILYDGIAETEGGRLFGMGMS